MNSISYLQNSPILGYAHHQIILDEAGNPFDYQFLEVNNTFERLTGLKANDIIGKTVCAVIPGFENEEFNWISFYGDVALHGGEKSFEQYSKLLNRWYRVHVYSCQKMQFTTMFFDITETKQQIDEQIQAAQIQAKLRLELETGSTILAMIAANKPLHEIFTALCYFVESSDTTVVTSVLLVDSLQNKLVQAAAPSLPPDYCTLLKNGLSIGLQAGSCGAAAFSGKLVISTDVQNDPRWATNIEFVDIARLHNLNACWSMPIVSPSREIVGVFSNFRSKPGAPTAENLRVLQWAAQIASMAIEKQRSAEEQRHNAEKYQHIFENVGETILVVQDTIIKLGNRNAEKITGFSLQELLGQPFIRFVHPNDKSMMHDRHAKRMSGELQDETEYEFRIICKNGETRWMKNCTTITEWDGKRASINFLSDITERKQMEDAAQRTAHNFRTFFDSMQDMVVVGLPDGRVLYANDIIITKLGYSLDELNAIGILGLHPSEMRAEAEDIFAAMFRGERNTCPLPLQTKSGARIPVETRVSFGLWDGKECVFGIIKDLTLEHEVQHTFNMLFEVNPAMMALSSLPERRYTEVNQAFIEQTKLSREQIIGKTAVELGLIADMEQFKQSGEILARTGRIHNAEMSIRTSDGALHTGLFSGEIVKIHGAPHLLTVMVDITEKKQAEEALLEQSELQKMLMTISTNFINVSLDKMDEAVNSALAMLGTFTATDRTYIFMYDRDKNICINTYEWCNEGIEPQIAALQAISLEIIPEWANTHFAGMPVHISDVMALPPSDPVRQILESQDVKSVLALPMMSSDVCVGFVGFDAVTRKHVFSEKESSLLTLFALMLVNVFNRNKVHAELLASKAQAEAASRAKSEFLANMSHEIRTPLNGVIGFTDLLQKTPLTPMQKQYVDNANVSGHILLDIINDILDFSKIEAGMMTLEIIQTDMIELLENCVDIIKFAAGKKNIEILLNIDPRMPRFAMLDPIRLKQIIANLLGNAVKFTEKGEVELKVLYSPLNDVRGTFSFFVRDTGIGISEPQKEKLFKAFSQADSSTTRKFGGTGLGLIISDMIAQKMDSHIDVISSLGHGSTFYFDVITDTEVGEARNHGDISRIKRCLIVDDNANNRLILENILLSWNIKYESCDNGLAALKALESSHFDATICDYNMPYIDGIETIRLIREKLNLSPDKQPIILLHSSSDDIELHAQCDALGVRFCLSKPVKQEQLFACLATIHEPKDKICAVSEYVAPQATVAKPNDVESMNVLVAEDVMMNMLLTTSLLSEFLPHARIIEAENGKVALQKYRETVPDLILMDVQMPEMDGLTATKIIRELERGSGRHVTIIALTAGALKVEMERCFQVGMDDFLTKPIEPGKLKTILYKYAQASEMPKTNSELVLFDRNKLIANCGVEVALKMVEIIKTNMPRLIESIQLAHSTNDLQTMKEQMHRLKGAALNGCLPIIVSITSGLEKLVSENATSEELHLKLNELEQAWRAVKDELS